MKDNDAMGVNSVIPMVILMLLCASGEAAADSPKRQGHTAQTEPDPLTLAVKHTILKAADRFQRCYLDYLKQGGSVMEGNLTVDWQITPKGNPIHTELVASSFAKTDAPSILEPCVVNQVAALVFPPTGKSENHYAFHKFRFKNVDTSAVSASK